MNYSELRNAVTNHKTVTLRTDDGVPTMLRGVKVRLMDSHFYGSSVTIGFLDVDGHYTGKKMTVPLEWLA